MKRTKLELIQQLDLTIAENVALRAKLSALEAQAVSPRAECFDPKYPLTDYRGRAFRLVTERGMKVKVFKPEGIAQ